jgi:hypothetical protein
VRWRDVEFHVGSNASYRAVGGPSALADGAMQTVTLDDGTNGSLRYDAIVRDGQWSLELPFFLIAAFERGDLSVSVPIIA